MEKVLEWLVKIKDKIVEFWNKYTAKQKTIIIVVFSIIVLGLALLTFILNQKNYTTLRDIDDTKVLGEIIDSLDKDSIPYKLENVNSGKSTRILVDDNYLDDANNILVKNGNLAEGMTWDDALTNDMTTSSEEKQTKAKLALQTTLKKALLTYQGVQDATIIIDKPIDNGTIYGEQEEASVSVLLALSSGAEMSETDAKAMAYFVASAVGNKSADKVIITDTKRNILFGKLDDDGLGADISDAAEYRLKLQKQWGSNISKVLMKQGFDDVEVGTDNIVFDMDKVTELVKEYTVAEGQDQGYLRKSYTYKSTGTTGSSGTPGTDSNSGTTDTMIDDSGNSNSEVSTVTNDYLPNEMVKNIEREQGALKKDESSIGIVATHYVVVHEETLKSAGKLDNITFEEYAEQNKQPVVATVDQTAYTLVSNATGIPVNKITINGFTKNVFQAAEPSTFNATNYLMIVLAVLIAALLVFVIVKGTSPVEVTESEPELSVEDLLATTVEERSLEDIEMGEKSELRRHIDKFVDENPEAVALLLRNWISDEWG